MGKYRARPGIRLEDRRWPDARIESPPVWCIVDLRDGNQALAVPMSVSEKMDMFQLLVAIGFKEIEVGFPSASQIEFDFIRRLIGEGRVPDDVSLQVLTQAREHLITRTFESVKGARSAIVHLYNSTSPLQRQVTFGMSREEVKELAVRGAELVKSLVPTLTGTRVRFEYSPESFSDTEMEYALEVCEAVSDVWQPTPDDRIILNLPATVEAATPNVHADQIEWFCRHVKDRRKVVISLHTHNDRGTGVAATELALMAGADRVEGTLFGNGERTGNLDIVTTALNMYSQGVDPGLDLSDLPRIREVFERCTRMEVPPRHPYAGDLVFTAFSGSHQDAIKKGMDRRRREKAPDAPWEVPYLLVDPEDIGRNYQAIIRINSQSGKGGVAYVMDRDYGFELPKKMHPEVGAMANRLADDAGRELTGMEVYEAFRKEFLNTGDPLYLTEFNLERGGRDQRSVECRARVAYGGKKKTIHGRGNGPIDAFVHAMDSQGWKDFQLLDFHEHSIGEGSETEAVAYVQIETRGGQRFWGAGRHTSINLAGLKALISAYNRSRSA